MKALQKNPSFYFVLSEFCTTFAPANGKSLHGALDEWLSQRSAKPCTPVRIGYAPPEKDSVVSIDVDATVFCFLGESCSAFFHHAFQLFDGSGDVLPESAVVTEEVRLPI